jgi:hypothetical protein
MQSNPSRSRRFQELGSARHFTLVPQEDISLLASPLSQSAVPCTRIMHPRPLLPDRRVLRAAPNPALFVKAKWSAPKALSLMCEAVGCTNIRRLFHETGLQVTSLTIDADS